MTNFKEGLKTVKAFAFDVDGVLSKPEVYLHPSGDLMRSMNTKDGYALQYAVKRGYPIAIITGGTSQSVAERFRGLGITDIYLASSCKTDDFTDFLFKYDLKEKEVLYMGNSIRCPVGGCVTSSREDSSLFTRLIRSCSRGGT